MTEFFDRYGVEHKPQKGDIIRPRNSIHIVLYHNTKGLLLSYPPHAQNSAELVGGGIEKGEDLIEAAAREIEEETGLAVLGLKKEQIQKEFSQDINFYADVDKEYWLYNMTFWKIEITASNNLKAFLEKDEWFNNGGERLVWTPFTKAPLETMQYFHKNAIKYFFKS
ncbi:MAG: NUDIX domain-containing protein [Alphaproteobacteria bacterium]